MEVRNIRNCFSNFAAPYGSGKISRKDVPLVMSALQGVERRELDETLDAEIMLLKENSVVDTQNSDVTPNVTFGDFCTVVARLKSKHGSSFTVGKPNKWGNLPYSKRDTKEVEFKNGAIFSGTFAINGEMVHGSYKGIRCNIFPI